MIRSRSVCTIVERINKTGSAATPAPNAYKTRLVRRHDQMHTSKNWIATQVAQSSHTLSKSTRTINAISLVTRGRGVVVL